MVLVPVPQLIRGKLVSCPAHMMQLCSYIEHLIQYAIKQELPDRRAENRVKYKHRALLRGCSVLVNYFIQFSKCSEKKKLKVKPLTTIKILLDAYQVVVRCKEQNAQVQDMSIQLQRFWQVSAQSIVISQGKANKKMSNERPTTVC